MSRIDVQTLVLAFERRIEALEKNPPDKVPTSVIMNLLEKSIDEIIKEHFKIEMRKLIKTHFKEMKTEFITKTLDNMLTDSNFILTIENRFKKSIMDGIK